MKLHPLRPLLVASVVVSVALSLAAAPPVLAEPKDPSHNKVLIANQAALDEFSSSIEKDPGLIQAGYIASFHDVENRALELKWHNMPAKVQADLTAQATQLGVKLTIVSSKFTRSERGRANAAIQSQAQTFRKQGFEVVGLSEVNRDDDGLIALVRPDAGLSVDKSSKVVEVLQSVTGMPVRVKLGDVSWAATRTTDSPNFASGGFMKETYPAPQSVADACTAGFGVSRAGVTYVTTARHCYRTPYKAFSGTASYGNSVMATSLSGARLLDSRAAGVAFVGWIGSNSTLRVGAVRDVWYGDFVCTSGGNSGEHCGVQVSNSYYLWYDGYGDVETLEAWQTGAGVAAVKADSGGPVMTYRADGKVDAVGMIQAIGLGVNNGETEPCPAVNYNFPGIRCSRVVYFSRTSKLLSEAGASLVTG